MRWYKGIRIRNLGSTLTIDWWSFKHSELRPVHHINYPVDYKTIEHGYKIAMDWIDKKLTEEG